MVHFVGAGCGAADLITVRGAELLSRADVVVWAGSLVNPELLERCRAGAEIHDSSRMTLSETTAVLADAEARGLTSVRLHTGDPALYGAMREQMEELERLGIPFDVVPGVSSLFGAAAALRTELTVPGASQSLIVTRLGGRTAVPESESLRSLASHGAGMAVFLSAARIGEVVAELLAGGAFTERTEAAVVYRASWSDEKIVRGTLGDIAEKARSAGIDRHALILAGGFLGRGGRSRLYAPDFSTAFRIADECVDKK